MGKIGNKDFFKVLVTKGEAKTSGLDKSFNSYRVIGYQGKDFKLTLKEVKQAKRLIK